MAGSPTRTGFPPQIKYIVGNEACERFSFYGMRSILTVYMVKYLMLPEYESKSLYHLFVSAAYFTPLFGAYLSDRYWGKYKTIIRLSLVYCLGHAVLAGWDGKLGLFFGLVLIAIGSGGIKPCVTAHVGDQFDATNQHLIAKIFDVFYWSINFGAFFSTLLIPWMLDHWGPSPAFGLPGVLMVIATIIFWIGREKYVIVPPTGKENASKFLPILGYALAHRGPRAVGGSWLDTAKPKFGDERVEDVKAVLEVFKLFVVIAMFWSLWDQQGSSWVLQAEKMDPHFLGFTWASSQMQALNAILILVLVPVFSVGVFPLVEKMGVRVTPIRKMGAGMFVTAACFGSIGILQLMIDAGWHLSIGWQFVPYVLLSVGEILVSITGLEFAYTQAPRSMKSTVMSFFLLTIAAGNFLTSVVSYLNRLSGAGEFFFYGGVMFLVSFVYVWRAYRYRGRTYLEPAAH